jgi:hypothetical protein
MQPTGQARAQNNSTPETETQAKRPKRENISTTQTSHSTSQPLPKAIIFTK